ncbi:class I SAM-dependent methyltransferase [Aerosakkonema sp. BLCC-F183]|uniref:class I SAM-dependent methyltransferase n=1 Tax=Aerosakkonema sp. BLCC-F183 TaxID=3342834 RepID=UPI0035BA0971
MQPTLPDMRLCEAIALRISQTPQQRITFAEYMDLVLYHPQHGYYASDRVNIGAKGDFVTSPHMGADFGELLAEQFADMWQIMGCPVPFTLVEMGAGQGILAGDVLVYLQRRYPDLFNAIEYLIVEKSPALKKEQQQRLQDFPLRWCELSEIPSNSIVGCCFSNELVDAFPVHQFAIERGQLREIYVTIQDGINFIEVTDEPSTERLNQYFELLGIDIISRVYPDGYRSEVNLAALDWLSAIADKLQRGYLLTIDYGYPGDRYYNPARNQGTLQCYYQHRHHDNPYINIGQQDITAHVNFTALEKWGELCGLQKIGFTQQALFLMALGLGDRIASLSSSNATDGKAILQILQRRDALHQMMNPMGLGGFGVLIQCKGLTEKERLHSLKGLSMP